jgi:hypothetical protein
MGNNRQFSRQSDSYRFNFIAIPKAGYVSVPYDRANGVQRYTESEGYGFVEWTAALPPRQVYPAQITAGLEGVVILEPQPAAGPGPQADDYNNFGITRAAKSLYYMWVLIHPVGVENDVLF